MAVGAGIGSFLGMCGWVGHDALVSLLSHLHARDSPVRAFFASRLPNTAPVVRNAAARLRDGRKNAPLAAPPGVNAGRAGTAIDYLVRFGLAREPCPRAGGAAAIGAGRLEGRVALAAGEAVQQALQFVHTTASWEREVTDPEWKNLARIALLFAVFEQTYRSGVPPDQFAQLKRLPAGWREWTELVCVPIELEDVAIVGQAAVEDHASMRGTDLICNPVFAQSAALRGADADLITDTGLLLDLKSTSTTKNCSTVDIWQLCGYALADTNDQYKIRSVGLSALRWRTQCSWALDELFPMLAGEPVSVENLRHDFAAVLEVSTKPRRRRTMSRPRLSAEGSPTTESALQVGDDGRMYWRCSFCGELKAAREGEPTPLPSGATMVRILPPSSWGRQEDKLACPACRTR
jgi:hypothetical protein